MWIAVLVAFVWLMPNDGSFVTTHELRRDVMIDYTRGNLTFQKRCEHRLSLGEVLGEDREIVADDEYILKNWQDWVLANLLVVNYLNRLMVITSRGDFVLTVPDGYHVTHVQNIGSFKQTIAQLSQGMRGALKDAREALNRVQNGMEGIPNHLKTMVLFIKHADTVLLDHLLANSSSKIETLVNDSLIVLRQPEKSFGQVLNLLIEIDHLLSNQAVPDGIRVELDDVRAQWTLLHTLITEMAKHAERTRESLLLQFTWMLQNILRPELNLTDDRRNFIIELLIPKIVEIDRKSDILLIASISYTYTSFEYTDEQVSGNANLLLLTDEKRRQDYLKELRSTLRAQAIRIARFAHAQYYEFVRRDRTRKKNYEKFLLESSIYDLIALIPRINQ